MSIPKIEATVEITVTLHNLGDINKAAQLKYDWGCSDNIKKTQEAENHIEAVVSAMHGWYRTYHFRSAIEKEVRKLVDKKVKELEGK